MRHCGSCTLCCKLIPVEEINKAAGQRCQHVKAGKGCSIYERRPISCREWSCMWLKGSEDDRPLDLHRPDRSHYVIDEVPDIIRATNNVTGEVTQIDVMQIWCDPKFPDAWRDPALLAMLERQGIVGLVRYSSDRGFTIFPPKAISTGQWQITDTQSAEDLRGAQRAARFAFWSRQAQGHPSSTRGEPTL
jgi:hypothetical protein